MRSDGTPLDGGPQARRPVAAVLDTSGVPARLVVVCDDGAIFFWFARGGYEWLGRPPIPDSPRDIQQREQAAGLQGGTTCDS